MEYKNKIIDARARKEKEYVQAYTVVEQHHEK